MSVILCTTVYKTFIGSYPLSIKLSCTQIEIEFITANISSHTYLNHFLAHVLQTCHQDFFLIFFLSKILSGFLNFYSPPSNKTSQIITIYCIYRNKFSNRIRIILLSSPSRSVGVACPSSNASRT